jgi:hypothetical protein
VGAIPYGNSVTLLDTEGGPLTTQVVARLWKLESPGFGTHHWDVEEEITAPFDVHLDESAAAPFSFTSAASFPNRSVGLSIQDAHRVAPTVNIGHPGTPDTGWHFRSGSFATFLPSTSPIDVIAARDEITAADLPSLLPSTPLTVDAKTTITKLDGTLADPAAGNVPGGVDLTATGNTTKTGAAVGFTFSGRIVPTPSTDIAEPTAEAVAVDFVNENEQLLAGANLAPADEQALWDSLRDFVTNTVVPQIRRNIESHVENRIVGAVGRSLGSAGLPAGVILSVRSVNATSQHLVVRGALGSFGTVASKLPAPSGGGGGGGISCPLHTLASLGLPVSGLDVLRAVRDESFAATETGRFATAAYYRFETEVSLLLTRNPRLAVRAAALAGEITAALRAGEAFRVAQRRRCEDLLRDLAAIGSPELRAAIAQGLEAGVTGLL